MATDYPITISDDTDTVRLSGSANFTDSGNAPAGGSGPLTVPETGTTVLVTDTPDGDDLMDYDADASRFNFGTHIKLNYASGMVDAASLGSTIPYVTVQDSPPTTYQTPAVYDNTAVTGGLYLWDGSAYQQVGNVVA